VEVVALLALDAVAAVEESVVVEAVVEKIQGAIVVSPVGGKQVELRFFVVLQHKVAELAVGEDVAAAVEVHNLGIEALALAEEHPEAGLASGDPACAGGDRVGAAGEVDHYGDCR
jgi:hypothetical protein